jgi:biogenesis of lysosome-related organelles complex 1 subunit 2
MAESLPSSDSRAAALEASTSTLSAEGTQQPISDPIMKLGRDMFAKTANYLNGEFESTADEYRLLERMNKATLAKYLEMKEISSNLSKTMVDLKEKYESLQPYLEMIDQLDESVSSLEQAAYKLDSYSKRLEAKFKQLEKK